MWLVKFNRLFNKLQHRIYLLTKSNTSLNHGGELHQPFKNLLNFVFPTYVEITFMLSYDIQVQKVFQYENKKTSCALYLLEDKKYI